MACTSAFRGSLPCRVCKPRPSRSAAAGSDARSSLLGALARFLRSNGAHLLKKGGVAFSVVFVLFIGLPNVSAEVFDPPKTASLVNAPVNLRSGPSLSDPVVGRVESKDVPVKVLESREGWVKIQAGGQQGWIYQALVAMEKGAETKEAKAPLQKAQPKAAKKPPASVKAPAAEAKTAPGSAYPADGKTTGTQVRLRSGPSLSDEVVAVIEEEGSPIEVLEGSGDWLRVRYQGTEGWVFSSLVAVSGTRAAPQRPPEAQMPSASAAEKPAAPTPEKKPTSPSAAKVEPGQAEPVAVMIRKITFSGNRVIDTGTLQKAAQGYQGRELTLEDMSELVDQITIAYQERGYILARAYLPKQDIADGVLHIAVMEGNIGKIEVAGKTHYDEKLVKKYFDAQLTEGVVKESALEKGLLLANELPDLKTNVVLKKGEKPGDVDVVVNTEDSSRMTLGLEVGFDYNNFGTKLTSRNRYGTTIKVVDHKYGTITDLRGVMGDNVHDSFLGSAEFSLPVGSKGTRASAGYLYGNYIVGQNFADLGLDGYTKIASAKISTPLLKKKNRNLDFTLGWDNKYTKNYILGQERSIDEANVVYGTFNFDNLDRFLGKNILSATASFGEVGKDDLVATSRTDSDIHYERFNASYARVQKLFGQTNLFLRGAGQYSNDRLIPIEQFVIGGYGTVRGYDPALYLGDSGYALTAELMFAPPYLAEATVLGNRLSEMLQFALFYDDGYVSINNEIPGEVGSHHLSGWGGGVRLFYKDRFYFKYDLGLPLIRIPGKDMMFHYFQVGYQLW